jgi:hypothetical protein
MKKPYREKTDDGVGIGDVSKICGVPVHTVRYWEREFCQYLQPQRTIGKQRRYSDLDIARILEIKKLLWGQRFSIKGAKKVLSFQILGAHAPVSGMADFFTSIPQPLSGEQFLSGSLSIPQSVE